MKKKILLKSLMIAMLIFVFSVVASAKSYICIDEATGEKVFEYEIASGDYPITSYSNYGFAKYDSDGNALTWYRVKTTTLETGEVQYTVKAEKTRDLVKDNGDGILQSSEITNYGNLMSITFDEDCGITEFGQDSNGSGLFHKIDNGKKYFLFADIPDSVTKLSNNCFRNCITLISVGISENSKLEDFGSASFYGCTSLRSIYIPKGIKTLKTEYVSNEQYWDHGLFKNCQSLGSVTFAEDSTLEVIEKCAFYMCYSLKEITLPNSVKTLHPRVFTSCTSLEYINFGAGLVEIVREIGGNDEYVSLFQKSEKIKTLVLPATFKAENLADDLHTAFAVYGSQYTIYYAGTEEEFVKLQNKFALAKNGSGNKGIINATYNYINPCVAFFDGVHGEITSSGVCVGVCGVCGDTVASHNDDTSLSISSIVYSDYSKKGTKTIACQNENCTYSITEEASALFECLGYSVGPDGYSLKSGFKIDKDALNEYKSLNPDFEFGIVIVNAKSIASDDSLFVNGSLNSSAKGLQVEISSVEYTIWNADIANFNADIADDFELAIGIYATNNDGNVSLMQYVNTDKYTTTKAFSDMSVSAITFNQVRVGHGMDALVPTTTGEK